MGCSVWLFVCGNVISDSGYITTGGVQQCIVYFGVNQCNLVKLNISGIYFSVMANRNRYIS